MDETDRSTGPRAPRGRPTLHMLCGKAASGKSTLAARLAAAPAAILISEDFWTSRLFGPELKTVDDYIRLSRRLREAMGPHVEALLKAGLSVVLDFPANTPAGRQWMRGLFERAGADHRLHFLDMPDELCRQRLHRRNESGAHEFTVSDAEFDRITAYFVPPSPGEGFQTVVYGAT
ncbi:MAG: ATP-binding protein [Enhydrobacter sp.]|nr:MAG: ATP-binding protein [Enhydrobacter sp.]